MSEVTMMYNRPTIEDLKEAMEIIAKQFIHTNQIKNSVRNNNELVKHQDIYSSKVPLTFFEQLRLMNLHDYYLELNKI